MSNPCRSSEVAGEESAQAVDVFRKRENSNAKYHHNYQPALSAGCCPELKFDSLVVIDPWTL